MNSIIVRVKKMVGSTAVSRTQAMCLCDKMKLSTFDVIYMDFLGVQSAGNGFINQIFCDFRKEHPDIRIEAINANREIQDKINTVNNENPLN